MKRIDKRLVKKLINVVDQGLTVGMGVPMPGSMCVEAAVCYVFGEEHSDAPKCVSHEINQLKIGLNDRFMGTKKQRARFLRKLAVAQLGSKKLNSQTFLKKFLEEVIPSLEKFIRRKGYTLIDHTNPFDIVYSADVFRYWRFFMDKNGCHLSERHQQQALRIIAAAALKVLIDMKSPGTKYLHLL